MHDKKGGALLLPVRSTSYGRCFLRPRRAVSGPEFRGTTRVVTRLKMACQHTGVSCPSTPKLPHSKAPVKKLATTFAPVAAIGVQCHHEKVTGGEKMGWSWVTLGGVC